MKPPKGGTFEMNNKATVSEDSGSSSSTITGTAGGSGSKINPELLRNQRLWIKPVDFLSKEIFRFSVRGVKNGSELFKGTFEKGAVHMGNYTAVEVSRVVNQM